MKVAIVGNCQVSGLRAAALAMLPDAEVCAFHIGQHVPGAVREAAISSDYVITGIRNGSPQGPLLSAAALRRAGVRAVHVPPFIFPALQPDIVSIPHGGTMIGGVVGQYHSLIAIAGFRLALTAERTLALYNAHIFARLGYFEAIAAAEVAVLSGFAKKGYDLKPYLARWRAHPVPFMHAPNHPAIPVLATLATLALERLGLVPEGAAPPEAVDDALSRSFVLPVYPEIARRAGVPVRTGFLRQAGADREVSMRTFVEASLTLYRTLPAEVLDTERAARVTKAVADLLAEATYAPPKRSFASVVAM